MPTSSRRDHLVDTASNLFARDGFRAVGIERILHESGVAKMTLYKHFRSKDDLIVAVLRQVDDRCRRAIVEGSADPAFSPRERVLSIFDVLHAWLAASSFRGCMFAQACAEYPDDASAVRRAALEHKRFVRDHVVGLLLDAGITNPGPLADQLMMLFEGATVLSSLHKSAAPARDARSTADRLLVGAGMGSGVAQRRAAEAPAPAAPPAPARTPSPSH